jgi:hypothetical protein
MVFAVNKLMEQWNGGKQEPGLPAHRALIGFQKSKAANLS